jgi:hypothetical protein
VRTVEVTPFGQGTLEESVDKVLTFLGADLAADRRVKAAVLAHARELTGQSDQAP